MSVQFAGRGRSPTTPELARFQLPHHHHHHQEPLPQALPDPAFGAHVLLEEEHACRCWRGWAEVHGRRLDIDLYVTLSRRDVNGLCQVQGMGCDDVLGLWIVTGAVRFATRHTTPQLREATTTCALHLSNCHSLAAVDLRGSFEQDGSHLAIKGSSYAERSMLMLGRFGLSVPVTPCDTPVLHLMMKRVFRIQNALRSVPVDDMSCQSFAHLLESARLCDAARKTQALGLGPAQLLMLSPDELASTLDVPNSQAQRVSAILDGVLNMEQASNLMHGMRQSPLGDTMALLNIPFVDPVFFMLVGLPALLQMPIRQLVVYTACSGADASRMIAAHLPRVWETSRSHEFAQARDKVVEVAAAQPNLRARDLLALGPRSLRARGLAPFFAEAFNFFKEYVFFIGNRDTILRSVDLAQMLNDVIAKDCMGSTYTLLRVGRIDTLAADKKEAIVQQARSENMSAMLAHRLCGQAVELTRPVRTSPRHSPRHSPRATTPSDFVTQAPASQTFDQPPAPSMSANVDAHSAYSQTSSNSGLTFTSTSDNQPHHQVTPNSSQRFPPPQPFPTEAEIAFASSSSEDEVAPGRFRLCTMLLSAVSIGQIVVSGVMFSHMKMAGVSAGKTASQCETPMLGLAIIAILAFVHSRYRGCMAMVVRLWRGSTQAYLREFVILLIIIFPFGFAIGEAVKFIVNACMCEGTWWHLAHIVTQLVRTLVLLIATAFHRAARHCENDRPLSREFKKHAGEFHTSLVVFTVISDLCFTVFFIFEMPPLDTLSAPAQVNGVQPLFDGSRSVKEWLPMLAPLWALDLLVCLWFTTTWIIWLRKLMGLWKKQRERLGITVPSERTPLRP